MGQCVYNGPPLWTELFTGLDGDGWQFENTV